MSYEEKPQVYEMEPSSHYDPPGYGEGGPAPSHYEEPESTTQQSNGVEGRVEDEESYGIFKKVGMAVGGVGFGTVGCGVGGAMSTGFLFFLYSLFGSLILVVSFLLPITIIVFVAGIASGEAALIVIGLILFLLLLLSIVAMSCFLCLLTVAICGLLDCIGAGIGALIGTGIGYAVGEKIGEVKERREE